MPIPLTRALLGSVETILSHLKEMKFIPLFTFHLRLMINNNHPSDDCHMRKEKVQLFKRLVQFVLSLNKRSRSRRLF